MEQQPSSTVRFAAVAATVIALLAISVPFIWQHDVGAERADEIAAAPASMMAPLASHDESAAEQQTGAACDADAKPANMDFLIKDLDGKDVKLSSYKGKVVLLNFWATWCGPCKAEIPGFVELQEKYKKDLIVVGYSVDDTADKARAFAT